MRKLFVCGAALLAACGDGTGPSTNDSRLDVGDARTVGAQERAALRVEGGDTGGEYVLIPFNADSFYVTPAPQTGPRTDSTKKRVQLTVSGAGVEAITGPPTPALIAEGGPRLARAAGFAGGARPDDRFHMALRTSERAARLALRPTRTAAAAGGARFATAAAVPAVGDIVPYNTNARQACSAPAVRGGRVMAVTQRAIVVADTANPAGGFTAAEYAQFGQQFDNLVYEVDAANFGTPGDMDANSRVVIFFTKAVNELTEVGSSSYVGGFFYGRDLFPRLASGSYGGCAGSNQAELFYMLVPDPARAAGNENSPFSKTRVASQTIGVLAHEFQHLINLSLRELQSEEDIWLNEGLSHIAEEMVFYKASGLQARQNIAADLVASGRPNSQAFLDYQNANFNRLNQYLAEPEGNSPYADNDELPTRGATWQLLRYLADRKGGDQAATFRSLVKTQAVGMRNLRNVFGQDALELVRDWSVAQYADDAAIVGGTGSRYAQPSWNYRDIFPRYSSNNNRFPLKVRSLAAAGASLDLVGGGAAYLRFRVPPNTTATISSALASGAALPATVQMTLLRTK